MSVKWTSFIMEKRIAIRFVVWQVIAICRGLSIGELQQVPNRSKWLSDFVSKSTLVP